MKASIKKQQLAPQSTVVITVNNRTNRIPIFSFSISKPIPPGLKAGIFMREAMFLLLQNGYKQVSKFRGNKFTVIGYVLPAA